MADIVAKRVSGLDRLFATPDGANGLALIVEKPTRNHGMLQLAGGVYRQAQHAKPASKWTLGRFVKLAAFGLISVGILLIPIPDGVELSAQVEAAQKRVITAPLSTTIAEVLVKDRAPVVGGKTPLLRLDANEIKIDLIGVQAERAAAILERETARASRNPALLRNAELEVQRLESRLALLELQRDSSTVITPISGIAILPELQQKLGSTVRQGEVLMEVIDPSALRLSLAILESRISKVEEGTAGIFRPDFDPTLRVAARLTTISPALDNTQDIPVIQARADFEDATDTLRPGLSGIFSVGAEYRPIGEVLYRAIRNWVLLRLWI
jgi:multidrug resistance efflux pump